MASIALNETASNRHGKPSIAAHPAFPLVVALWFAALLGLGSLILPMHLFERLSMSSGLAALFAPAAPPLGVTARAVLAVSAALGGALFGYVLARLALGRNASPGASRSALYASEELDPEGLDPHRPRDIAIVGGPDRSDEVLPEAALPVDNDEHHPLAPTLTAAYRDLGEPNDLAEIGAFLEAEEAAGDRPAPEADEEYGMSERQAAIETGALPDPIAGSDDDPRDGTPDRAENPAADPAAGSPGSPEREVAGTARPQSPAGMGEQEEARRSARAADPLCESHRSESDRDEPDTAPTEHFASPADATPLEELGLMQLVQRLGASIEKHRAAHAASAALPDRATYPRPVPSRLDVAEPEDAASAMAAFFGRSTGPAAHIAARKAISDAEAAAANREWGDGCPDMAPPHPIRANPAGKPFAADACAPGDDEGDPSAGSTNPDTGAKPEFVRGEPPEPAPPSTGRPFDPPGGRGAAGRMAGESRIRTRMSSEDDERALREALMNLQSMGRTG